MMEQSKELHRVIAEMAVLIEQNDDLDVHSYDLFFQRPEYAFELVDLIHHLDENLDYIPVYSACVFAFEICVAQFQAYSESQSKVSSKLLSKLMNYLSERLQTKNHSLGFWLPVLNSFYEVQVDLTQELKDAYFDLAAEENESTDLIDNESHVDSIKLLINELSGLSVFDIAENFFAQSYAMPPEFFADLMLDLYSIEEGHDIALLILLHPKSEVREIAITTLNQVIPKITLSSISLSRLQVIQSWYPKAYYNTFSSWIRDQRKKGVVFAPESSVADIDIKATEVDGSGAQGVFIHLKQKRKNKLCGLLFKSSFGIKDAWVTPFISSSEVKEYYHQAFAENVTLRAVDLSYIQMMTAHFLALTIERNDIPNLHFLEILELLGLRLLPQKIEADSLFEELSIQINPFTHDMVIESLQRSKQWLKTKPFTESWYLESSFIDKIVNHNSNFVDGVKICRMAEAMNAVLAEEMEPNRKYWLFHFLWVTLWVKSKEKKNEKIWKDSFFIAYCIKEGVPFNDIPVMREICRQTVINSVETMQERKTHLSQE